jgi:hypothetical protein
MRQFAGQQNWQLATDHWQLFFPRSSRCLN